MKRTLVIADETHELEIHRRGGKTVMVWDGEEFPFDIVKVEPTSYSIIMNAHSVGVVNGFGDRLQILRRFGRAQGLLVDHRRQHAAQRRHLVQFR